jgi:uncharacterized protein YbjT (DUF2867 family)
MFTVFGSTGNTGRIVAETLLAAGHKVRLAVREPSKVAGLVARGAEAVVTDVLDAASVARALAGASAAYLLIPPDPTSTAFLARGERITENFVAGLTAAKVGHAVLLSSIGAQLPSGTGPIVTVHRAEQRLRAVPGLRLTALRAAYFMDNLGNFAHPMKTDGVLPVFGGGEQYPFPMVSTQDIGRVAAEELLSPPAAHDILQLAGPVEISYVDAAAAAGEVLGRKVTAVAAPLEQLVPTYMSFGISSDVANLYREMTAAFGTGTVGFDPNGRLVRGKVTVREALTTLLK